jgi:hypothetical protein
MKKMLILAISCLSATVVTDAAAMLALRRMASQTPARSRSVVSVQQRLEEDLYHKNREINNLKARKNSHAWDMFRCMDRKSLLQKEVNGLQNSRWLAFVRICIPSMAEEHERNKRIAEFGIEHNTNMFLRKQEDLIDVGIAERDLKKEIDALSKRIEDEKQRSSLSDLKE